MVLSRHEYVRLLPTDSLEICRTEGGEVRVIVLTIKKYISPMGQSWDLWDVFRDGEWVCPAARTLNEARKRVAEIVEEIKKEAK